jgi:N-acyl-D-amino-acid deacylase
MYDLVIRGGTVVDGNMTEPRTVDVAVEGGQIVGIGEDLGKSRATIEADGAVVTPGWIDGHTHYDGQATWDDKLEGSTSNGVTTVLCGNCGVGFAPVRPNSFRELIDLMEGVEDIPGTALSEGMPWGEWETFPEYLAFLSQRKWATDLGVSIAHGPLRYYVMGDRAVSDSDAKGDDLERMAEILTEAAEAGAMGFSTSRIMAHKSMSGDAVPGTFAPEAELERLAAALSAGGCRTFQVIPSSGIGPITGPEQAALSDEVRMFARISRNAGVKVIYSTFQVNDQPNEWRDVLKIAHEEIDAGADLKPMVSGHSTTALMTLLGYHAFVLKPTFKSLRSLPLDEMVRELRRPEVKERILREQDEPDARAGSMDNVMGGLFQIALPQTYPLVEPLDYEPLASDSIEAMATAEGRDKFEWLYDYLLEDGGRSFAIWHSLNYADGNLDAVHDMLTDPITVSGLSDAGAHVKYIADMALPTFHLTHWVRDRKRGPRIDIEKVVNKLTAAVADAFTLSDRGRLEVGKRADINVIDLQNLSIDLPRWLTDLPAGGSRILQPSTGYVATVLNGVITRSYDEDTGERPGRLVKPSRLTA